MNEKEKEKYILKYIYVILIGKRNENRYFSTMFGNIEEDKIVRIDDCISYLENKYQELFGEE